MKILVLGINCFPELTGIGKYSGEMVNWFAENNHSTTIVTSFPYYPHWKVQAPYSGKFYAREVYHNGRLKVYRCPMYIPENPSGLKRLMHEASFFLSAFFVVARLLFGRKYDVVMAIAPPFHLGFLALFYRFFRGGKIVYHIQDLQVDAAKELKMLPDWMFSVLFGMEKFLMRKVDYVSTISDGMIRRVKAKVARDIVFFPNWVDTTNFYPLENRDDLKKEWGFQTSDKIVLYSGSIGEKQGLDVLIRMGDQLKHITEFKIVICGTGPFKTKLMAMASEAKLNNVYFLPLQSNEVFNRFLNMADVHLVLQKGDASDLVMPSKLTTILAIGGLSLVTAKPDTTLYNVLNEHEMGVVIMPENELLLKEAIIECCSNDFSAQRKNARAYAEQYLNKENILKKVLTDI